MSIPVLHSMFVLIVYYLSSILLYSKIGKLNADKKIKNSLGLLSNYYDYYANYRSSA